MKLDLSIIKPKGILHLGAGRLEELETYKSMQPKFVLFVDADHRNITENHNKLVNLKDYYLAHSAISDKDDEIVNFFLSDNGGSSSLLRLKDHKIYYPTVHMVDSVAVKTLTVDTLLERFGLRHEDFDFVNIDLQGAELLALRGMTKVLPHVRYISIEVNFEELYDGCVLEPELNEFLDNAGFDCIERIDTGFGWGQSEYKRRGTT